MDDTIDKKETDHTESWITVLLIAVFSFIWYIIELKLDSIVLSMSTIMVMLAVVIGSVTYAIRDWKAGYKKSALLCIIGIVIQILVLVLYIFSAIISIRGLFL